MTVEGESFARRVSAHTAALAISAICAGPALRATHKVGVWVYYLPLSILVVVAVGRLITARGIPRALWRYACTLSALVCWLVASCAWTESTAQYRTDIPLLLLLLALGWAMSVVVDLWTARLAVAYIVCFGLYAAGIVVSAYVSAGTLRGYDTALTDYYLVMSQLVGIGAVAAAAQALVGERWRALWAASAIVLFGSLPLSMARGAMLSALVIGVLLGATVLATKPLRVKSAAGAGSMALVRALGVGTTLGAVTGVLWVALQVDRMRDRLLRLLSSDSRDAGRWPLWSESWHNIGASPWWGHGLGTSGILSGTGEDGYPHNLFLQVWLDGGLVAVLLLALLLLQPGAAGLAAATKRRFAGYWVVAAAMLAFVVLEYSKSTNFYTARPVIVFGTLLLVTAIGETESTKRLPRLKHRTSAVR